MLVQNSVSCIYNPAKKSCIGIEAQDMWLVEYLHSYYVAFHSELMSEAERNCEIYNKEMMAIMDSLSDWWQYLLGASETV